VLNLWLIPLPVTCRHIASFFCLIIGGSHLWKSFKIHERSQTRRASFQSSRRGRTATFFATLWQFLRFLWLCCKSPRTLVHPASTNTPPQREPEGRVAKSLDSVQLAPLRSQTESRALAISHGRTDSNVSGSTMVEDDNGGGLIRDRIGTIGPSRPLNAYLEPV
jgi:hypothetical protein